MGRRGQRFAADDSQRLDSSLTPPGPNPLIAFYRDGARDDASRTLGEILAWDDDRLEAIHDYIQWLFPLPEPSGANPTAPILDPGAIQAFRSSLAVQDRLRQSFQRMMSFYGFTQLSTPSGIVIERTQLFASRAETWLWPMNHNHLRLTRILRSMLLLGREAESKALFRALNALYREYPDRIPARTHAYWSNAAQS